MVFCFTINDRYLKQAKDCIQSLVAHNPGPHTIIILSREDLTTSSAWQDTVDLGKASNWLILYRPVDFGGYEPKFIHSKSWAEPNYWRLWIHTSLPTEVSKVLYMDTDIICKGSLDELWNIDLTGKLLAGADDYDPQHVQDYEGVFGDEGQNLQTGVLLLNLDFWRENSKYIQDFYYNSDQDEELKASKPTPWIRTLVDWLVEPWFFNKLAEKFPFVRLPLRYNFHTYYYHTIAQPDGVIWHEKQYIPNVGAAAYLQDILAPEIWEEYKNAKLLHYAYEVKPWDIPGVPSES